MAKTLSTFYPWITPHVLGCPEPLLNQGLLVAASQFCRESFAWQEVSTQQLSDLRDYDVEVPNQARLASVLGVFIGDSQLSAAGPDEVHSGLALEGVADTGTPRSFFQRVPYDPILTLHPAPDTGVAGQSLTIRAAFEPAITATTLPDFLFNDHIHAMVSGTLAYLMNLPGQSFTNLLAAAARRIEFRADIAAAKTIGRAGQARRSMRVQPRGFA